MTGANVSHLSLVHDDSAGYVDSWKRHLLAEDYRPLTIWTYGKCLDAFGKWLENSGRSTDLLLVSRRDCEAWFAHMTEAGNASNTKRSRWSAMRNFFGWLVAEDEIATNPMERIAVKREANEDTRILTEDEITQLLATCDGKAFNERRDRAIILFMLTTGVRKFECAAMKLGDVHLDDGVCEVHDGKGGKSRRVFLSPVAHRALDRYLRLRKRHPHSESEWLWLGKAGHFTVHGIDISMRARGKQAGLVGYRSHVLRHTWAHMNKRDGMSDGDLMELGGWSEPSMLHRYGKVAAQSRALATARKLDPFRGIH